MESSHHTGKWKQLSVPCILFLLAVLWCCNATEGFNNTESCFENEYPHNGYCCDKCPRGFKLKRKCSGQGLRSDCEKCSPGTYQDNMNHYPNCFSCRKACDRSAKEIEIANCTNIQDRKCGCEEGYYKYEVDELTMSCELCKKCGEGEREISPCKGQEDTVCDCKQNYYRVHKGYCAPCTNCSSECKDLCPRDVMTTRPSPHTPGFPLQAAFIGVCVAAGIGLVTIILYSGVKRWKKRKQSLYSQSPVSCDPENQVGMTETHTGLQNEENEDATNLLPVQRDPVLPDCIPKEIKTHEFIYSLLDIVPVGRFKELARRLNVSEQDIDRAERDNRAFADAQYQMLIVWIDSSTRGGRSILPRPLLQECMDRLKDMNLTACAESIEEKYA